LSYYANYNDVLNQLQEFGLLPDEPLEVNSTKKAIRCKTSDNQREKRGWYTLYSITIGTDPHIVGAYGIWGGDDNTKQKIVLNKEQRGNLTKDQLQALRDQQRELQKQADIARQREADRAADKAKAAWCKFSETGDSPYLVTKQISAHGVRFTRDNSIVIPMRDDADAIRGLQFIHPPGHSWIEKTGTNKQFWPAGHTMTGTFHLIGDHPRNILLMAEGYATGASLHAATGHPVAVVWSANNILPAAQALHKKFRGVRILICADDDYLQKCAECKQYTIVAEATCQHCGKPHKKRNSGALCAEAAALAVSGAWMLPEFRDQRPTDKKGITDFNDLHCLEGLRQVRAQVAEKLDTLGWLNPSPGKTPAGVTPQGGGERDALKSMLNMDEALERFALVYGGKSTMFDRQEHILVPKQDVMDILPEHGWRDMRAHKSVVRLDEVGFDPAGTDKRITCNLYGGWPTVPKQGDCSKLLDLLRYLCSNEVQADAVFDWVIKWLAFPIQHPGAKMQTALVFHGPQGTGKNLFFESIMAIYGEYGRIVDQAAIEDKFNDWASKKLFLIADEVVARTELYHVKNKLKSFVTGEWIRINPKNVSAHDEKNHVNLVFLSNESTPLVLEHDDRRYMVIHTPEKLPAEFYTSVRAELDNGGIAALHHHLKNLDLTGFYLFTKPLATKAKQQLIEASLDSVSTFLRDWYAGDIHKAPFCPCLTTQLFTVYQRHCAAVGEKATAMRNFKQFKAELNMLPGWKIGQTAVHVSTYNQERTVRKMVVPPDNLLSESSGYTRVQAEHREAWLARCHEAFSIAGGFEQ
jgi:putative DNA primase/helicase